MSSISSTQTQLTSDLAIGYLIASGGNSKLAALNATRELDPNGSHEPPITEAYLLSRITQDPNSLGPLTQQLNLLLILNTVESLRLTHHVFIQSLPHLAPKEAALTYIRLLQTLTQIAHPQENNQGFAQPPPPVISPDQILQSLPTEVSAAIKLLMENSNHSNGSS